MKVATWKAITAAAVVVVGTALDIQVAAGPASAHGISPELQQRLATATSFSCDSGAKKLPVARVNDNYCDCEDGSDEPGTAACSHTSAKFYCANAGYFPTYLPTSRVNDKICDCCDGSDEYGSGTACPITCSSLMETFTTEKQGLLDVYNQGNAVREQIVANATQFWKEDQDQLGALAAEVETLKRSVSHLEKVKQEEELAETKERMDKAKETKREMIQRLGLNELSHEQLGFLVLELANTMYAKDDLLKFIRAERDTLGDSALEVEEAAWRERDEARQKETERITELKNERLKLKLERQKEREDAVERGETPPEETTEEEEEELQVPSVEERPVSLLFNQMSSFSSYERDQATLARERYSEAQSKLTTTERSVKDLQDALGKAYGPDNILYALRDKCFETKGGQYTYSMCFYGRAKQDYTSLGDMQAYEPDTTPNEVYFSGGTTCWNGPARSLRVTLECGVEPELYGVDEPSTCVYRAKFKTPIACNDAYKASLVAETAGGAGDAHTPHHIEVEVGATL